MNNRIQLLSNGDFIVLPMDEYSGLPSPIAYDEKEHGGEDREKTGFDVNTSIRDGV